MRTMRRRPSKAIPSSFGRRPVFLGRCKVDGVVLRTRWQVVPPCPALAVEGRLSDPVAVQRKEMRSHRAARSALGELPLSECLYTHWLHGPSDARDPGTCRMFPPL